ncbi:hypothetical protein ONS95_006263 [Cadophora gregata]|uniref:uncharacterized protein n=1 Tax=Cadophora gregata TaxID=51156 RepID=UPI0026DB91BC|nr:uncharacterized protein ONS95_006263 [Cadophora gregata]KAK0102659.1 hypothetical protein ONS95_006263 [Cadophora gregata]KAK0104315.1 hypothetical protein ONS96_005401 [Cadophora gregata f. sp. sojae]
MEAIKVTPALTAARKPSIGETGTDLEKFEYFEKLPSELRNRIYKIVLKHKGPIKIIDPRKAGARLSTFAAILATNKTIHSEAKGYLYSLNTFTFGRQESLDAFIDLVAKEYRLFITSIDLIVNPLRCSYTSSSGLATEYFHSMVQAEQLANLCRTLCLNFTSVTHITIRTIFFDCTKSNRSWYSRPKVHTGNLNGVAAAFSLFLDGVNGVKTMQDLKRLAWCHGQDKDNWLAETIQPHDWTDPGNIPTLVEGHRAELKDENGVYKPLLVSEADLEAYYESVGGV